MPSTIVQASQLPASSAEQHARLNNFKAGSSRSRADNVIRHGGDREADAAASHDLHCLSNKHVSARHVLRHLIRPEDLPVVICLLIKSFQAEWLALVKSDIKAFECGVCGEVVKFVGGDGKPAKTTFELIIERASVVKVVEKLLQEGHGVDGVQVMKLLCSPAAGNVVLSCCSNSQRAEDLSVVEDKIRADIVIGPAQD